MPSTNNLLCPTDGVQINETKVRVLAGLVWLITLVYLLSSWLVFPLFLLVDFGLRGFNLGQYSPLGSIAEWLVAICRLPYRRTDQAPKRFAARIGLVFSLLITVLDVLHISALLPSGVLFLFAALESFAGFCAGCYVFTYYIRLFPKSL